MATLEEKLEALRACGIALRDDRSINDLLRSWNRAGLEQESYRRLVVVLGNKAEDEPYGPLCNSVWHFDTECIEDHGAYVGIAERMRDLAKGDLPIENIRDHVDIDAAKAWLEFDLARNRIHWDLKVKDDWVDPGVFTKFVQLLGSRDVERQFTYMDLQGQDCLIGCATLYELTQLNRLPGLEFRHLT